MRAGRFPLACAVALALAPLWAARAAPTPGARVTALERVDVSSPPRVRLFVTELDAQKQVVSALPKPADVRLRVDDIQPEEVAVRVDSFVSAGETAAIMLVVQLGPAIEEVLPAVKAGLRELVDAAGPQSLIGVVGYTGVAVVDREPTSPGEAKTIIDGLTVDRDALELQLADALSAALKRLKTPGARELPRRKLIVMVSDGLSSSADPGKLTRLAGDAKGTSAGSDVRIHTLGYSGLTEDGLTTLAGLSKTTLGTHRAAKTGPEITEALRAVAGELRFQRVIDVDMPRLFDGKPHRFQLELSGRSTEVVQVTLPEHKVRGDASWRPILIAFAGFVLLAAAITLFVLFSRQSRARAQERLAEAQVAAPVEAPPPDKGNTIAVKRSQLPEAQARPEVAPPPPEPEEPQVGLRRAPPPPLGTDPTLLPSSPPPPRVERRSKPVEEELPTLLRGKMAALAEEPAAEPVLPGLPSPTQFLRRAQLMEQPPEPAVVESADKTEPIAPVTADMSPGLPQVSIPPESTEPEAPLPRAPSAPKIPDPAATGGMMAGKKTMIFNVTDVEQVDTAAWLVRPEAVETTVLAPGTTFPSGERFDLDGLGRWVMRSGDRPTVLSDGLALEVGGTRYVFKLAQRYERDVVVRKPFLKVIGGLDDGHHFELVEGVPRVIGASPRADATVRGKGVDPRHAVVRLQGDRCQVADLGSEAGIKVNGAARAAAELAPGQELVLGAVRLVFQVPR